MKNKVPATELRTSTLSIKRMKKKRKLCYSGQYVVLCFVPQLSLEPKIHTSLVEAHYHLDQTALEMALHFFVINFHDDTQCSQNAPKPQ